MASPTPLCTYQLSDLKYGSLDGAAPNPEHTSINNGYLTDSAFCGACHDVRPRFPDVVTGEDYQRLENLFTEWEDGPYGPLNNTVGGVVSCQDCHMDAGPPSPAGTYFEDKITVFPRPGDVTERRASTHYMTGVDVALIPFPGQFDTGLDSHGTPIGQDARRKDLLAATATISTSAPGAVQARRLSRHNR